MGCLRRGISVKISHHTHLEALSGFLADRGGLSAGLEAAVRGCREVEALGEVVVPHAVAFRVFEGGVLAGAYVVVLHVTFFPERRDNFCFCFLVSFGSEKARRRGRGCGAYFAGF